MSPNYAWVLKSILESNTGIASVRFSIVFKFKGIHLVGQPVKEQFNSQTVYNIENEGLTEEQITISVNNLQRLGLIEAQEYILSENNLYAFAKKTNLYKKTQEEFEKLKGTDDEPDYIYTHKMCISESTLGRSFYDICVLDFSEE